MSLESGSSGKDGGNRDSKDTTPATTTTRVQRPRANTTFSGAFASWRRNRPPEPASATSSASTSNVVSSSTPQPFSSSTTATSSTSTSHVLPLPTLLHSLSSSSSSTAVPSLTHARALSAALSTQAPALYPVPPPAVILAIVRTLCAPEQPLAFLCAGCEVVGVYCSLFSRNNNDAGGGMTTSDRMGFFEVVRGVTTSSGGKEEGVGWKDAELWEPRLKALNAVLASPTDTLGIEEALLDTLAGWLRAAVDALLSESGSSANTITTSTDTQQQQNQNQAQTDAATRAVAALASSLSSWSASIEDAGRLSEPLVLKQYAVLEGIVERVLSLPSPSSSTSGHSISTSSSSSSSSNTTTMVQQSMPSTPARENSSTSLSGSLGSTPQHQQEKQQRQKHRRHPSSASNLAALLAAHTSLGSSSSSSSSPHTSSSQSQSQSHPPSHPDPNAKQKFSSSPQNVRNGASTLIPALFLSFLSTRLSQPQRLHLPPSYLPRLAPLLFRVLGFGMASSTGGPPTPAPPLFDSREEKEKEMTPEDIEQRTLRTLSALLAGPYGATCLGLLKKCLGPCPSSSFTSVSSRGELSAGGEAGDTRSEKKAEGDDGAVIDEEEEERQVRTSLGAIRTLRVQVRRVLLARSSNNSSSSSSPSSSRKSSGRSDSNSATVGALWDARKVRLLLVSAIRGWVAWKGKSRERRERVLEEVGCLLRDVVQAMSGCEDESEAQRTDGLGGDGETETEIRGGEGGGEASEEAEAVGETLLELVEYVRGLRTEDGDPLPISLRPSMPTTTTAGSSSFLRLMSNLIQRVVREQEKINASERSQLQHINAARLLLFLAPHLPDADTARIPALMRSRHELDPTGEGWLENWEEVIQLLSLHEMDVVVTFGGRRKKRRKETQRAVTTALKETVTLLVDMPAYRRPLMERVFEFWMGCIGVREGIDSEGHEGGDAEVGAVMWKLLGDEVVLRSAEDSERDDEVEDPSSPVDDDEEENEPRKTWGAMQDANVRQILAAMISVSGYCDCSAADEQAATRIPPDSASSTLSPSPLGPTTPTPTPSSMLSSPASPVVSRATVESPSGIAKEKENGVPQQLMSLLSFATSGGGSGSRQPSQSHVPQLGVFNDSSSSASYSTPHPADPSPPLPTTDPSSTPPPSSCRGTTATLALLTTFSQLAFAFSATDSDNTAVNTITTPAQARLATYVFGQLLALLRTAPCARSRLAILKALMRLRADRDHRVYSTAEGSEQRDESERRHVRTLAALVDRLKDPTSLGQQQQSQQQSSSENGVANNDARSEELSLTTINFDELRKARPKQPLVGSMVVGVERDGRRSSRGRGSRTSTGSRSRSRVTLRKMQMQQMTPTPTASRPKAPLWFVLDVQDSVVTRPAVGNEEKPSQLLITYDTSPPGVADGRAVELPVSDYMDVLVEILKAERDWEILSYVLVHLPVQLANKHFWCGPKARNSTGSLLIELTKSISEGTLAKYVPLDEWPGSLKPRDAIGLAYHTLTVLISYQSIFEPSSKHSLVEILLAGLSGIPSTVLCCLNALTLCAFELQSSMVRALPRILEKLSQIMTNPPMAVHILTFLSIVASIPALYANFTFTDYKMVFGVALQYLQHHNRAEAESESGSGSGLGLLSAGGEEEKMSFALSQHVRIMAFYVVYVWFLNLRLGDRPGHVKFIVRQLLLANEGRGEVDAPTEVCFDWLARYTYASTDPKPARSALSDVLSTPSEGVASTSSSSSTSHPSSSSTSSSVVHEKSWVLGYSVVTIKTLAKPGWIEVISRRASGMTKFYCRNENFPVVDLGDVDPDRVTIPLSLMMNRDPRRGVDEEGVEDKGDVEEPSTLNKVFSSEGSSDSENAGEEAKQPDNVTGYVWSGSAPSQRRKHVEMDPSFFSLQFSSYPDMRAIHARKRVVKDDAALASFIRTFDRLPVIDTHKIGILYVAPGQTEEVEILRNTHGSPAYTRFLSGLGRLIQVGGQHDVYVGGLEPDEDGNYAYAWWDDIGQMLFHTATLMPSHAFDPACNLKKRHIGNDLVRIVWNDSGEAYRFDTLVTEFQFVNIVIEPHSRGVIAAYSNDSQHENEYFRVSVQSAKGMSESAFTPVGGGGYNYKIASAASLPLLVRQLALVADWYASVFKDTRRDTERNEIVTNWRARLEAIKRFSKSVPAPIEVESMEASDGGDIMSQEVLRDFAPWF